MASDSSTVAAGSPQVFKAYANQYRGCSILPGGQKMWAWLPAGSYVVGAARMIDGPTMGTAGPFTARELTPVGKSSPWLVSDEWLKRNGYDFDAKGGV